MSSSNKQVPKLKKSRQGIPDLGLFARRFEAWADDHEYGDILTGSFTLEACTTSDERTHFRNKNRQGYNDLQTALDDAEFRLIQNTKDLKTAWDTLFEEIQGDDEQAALNIEDEIKSLHYDGELFIDIVGQFESLCNDLEAIDRALSKKRKYLYFINMFEDIYPGTVDSLRSAGHYDLRIAKNNLKEKDNHTKIRRTAGGSTTGDDRVMTTTIPRSQNRYRFSNNPRRTTFRSRHGA